MGSHKTVCWPAAPGPFSVARMNSPDTPNRAEAVALARYGKISQIQELLAQHVPLRMALATVASSSPQ